NILFNQGMGLKFLVMTHAQGKTRHTQLVEEIRGHDYRYYVEAAPTIEDRQYDALYHELLDLEAQFPDLVTAESPSQRVGGQPIKAFKPVQHLLPMMSLDNTYSQAEVRQFVARVHRLIPCEAVKWVVRATVEAWEER